MASSTKLTEGTRARARKMLLDGSSTKDVARSLRVRRSSISAIKANLTRSNGHVTTQVTSSPSRVFGFNPGIMVEGTSAADAREQLVNALTSAGFLWDDHTLSSHQVRRSVWNESQGS